MQEKEKGRQKERLLTFSGPRRNPGAFFIEKTPRYEGRFNHP